MNTYKTKIKEAQDKKEIKKIVRAMLKDKKLKDDELTNLIREDVLQKLNEFGVEIIDYDDSANLSAYETVVRADY